MSKGAIQPWAVILTAVLLAGAALGYFVSPSAMLSVVGIKSSDQSGFLVRTLAAAFVAMLPMAWAVRRRSGEPIERAVLAGFALYLVLGSAVDLHAYLDDLVGVAAVPSVIVRTVLGLVLAWLALP